MLTDVHIEKLTTLATALVNQEKARVLVEPQDRSTGYWFGGGNVIQDKDGSFLVCGRFRNYGDSRTGTGAGARGLECAIYRSDSAEGTFEKIKSWSKADLAWNGIDVVSIEGTALHAFDGGIEFFISTEKDTKYPEDLSGFQKPGTGVWAIDRIHADSVENLSADSIEEIIPSDLEDIGRLHCKDPWVMDLPNGDLGLGYCTHPFTWSSSGTAMYVRKSGSSDYDLVTKDMLSRGPVWDIAAARVTERLSIPKIGVFADLPSMSLYFYDSCESLRQLDENPTAVARPRGWSCEEIGGIAVGVDDEFPQVESVSKIEPLFISPYGTGCSRYVATCLTDDGIFANWQQSQTDLSQPLVGNFVSMSEIESILA